MIAIDGYHFWPKYTHVTPCTDSHTSPARLHHHLMYTDPKDFVNLVSQVCSEQKKKEVA